MAVQLAAAYMQIIPSMKGFQGVVSKELAGVATSGEKAGASLGTGIAGSLRGRLFSAIPGAGTGVGNALGGSILGTVKRFAAPVTAAVAGLVSIEAIKKSVETFEAAASTTKLLQRQIGGTTQEVSGFVGAMQLSGVTVDKSQVALRMFSKNLGVAAQTSKGATKLTHELGFSFQDAHGQVLPMSTLLPKLADRFQAMPNGAAKTALAMQLFGRSGTTVLPFLNKGSAGMAELTAQAQKMGLVLDNTSIGIFDASRKSARTFGAAMQGAGIAVGQDFTVALDGAANVGRAALIPVFGAMSRVATALRPQFIAIGEAGDSIAKKLGGQLAPIVNRLAGEFIGFVQKADISGWAKTVSADIERVVGGLGKVGGGNILSAIGGIVKGFSPLQAILRAVAPILPQIVSSLGQAASTLAPVLAALATGVVAFLSPLLTSKAGILALVAAFVGFKVVSGIISAIAVAARIAAVAQVAWNIAMSANPIGIIVVAIAALVAALVFFFTQTKLGRQIWAGFVGFLIGAWNNIVAVAKVVWTAITANITGQINIVRGVITGVVGFIVGFWRASWAAITNVVRTVFGAVSGFIRGVINTIVTIIRVGVLIYVGLWILAWRAIANFIRPILAPVVAFISTVVTNIRNAIRVALAFIVGIWRTEWNVVRTVVTAVWNAVAGFVTTAVNRVRSVINAVINAVVAVWRTQWNIVHSVITTVWNAISAVVSSVVARVKGFISGALSTISGIWSRAWSAVLSVLSAAWSRIVSAVSGGVGRVISFVQGIGGKVLSAVSGFGTLLFNAGKSLIQGFINGIGSMIGAVGNIAKNAMAAAAQFFPHSPAKEGPFSGRGWTLYSGHAVGQGFADGMLRSRGSIRSAANDLMSSAGLQTQAHVGVNAAGFAAAGLVPAAPAVIMPNTITIRDAKGFVATMEVVAADRLARYDLHQRLTSER